MNIMAYKYHSSCDTIYYGPNNVTAKTMDALISSHYLFHGKLQFVHILYEKLVSVEMSFGRKSPMKDSHEVLHAHFASNVSQSRLLFLLLQSRNAEYLLFSEAISMTAKRRQKSHRSC